VAAFDGLVIGGASRLAVAAHDASARSQLHPEARSECGGGRTECGGSPFGWLGALCARPGFRKGQRPPRRSGSAGPRSPRPSRCKPVRGAGARAPRDQAVHEWGADAQPIGGLLYRDHKWTIDGF